MSREINISLGIAIVVGILIFISNNDDSVPECTSSESYTTLIKTVNDSPIVGTFLGTFGEVMGAKNIREIKYDKKNGIRYCSARIYPKVLPDHDITFTIEKMDDGGFLLKTKDTFKYPDLPTKNIDGD